MSMQQLLKQAQEMQKKILVEQEKFAQKKFVIPTNGNLITITMFGNKHVDKIKIDPQILADADAEDLEAMMLTAINTALDEVITAEEKLMKQFSDKMPSVPGMR